MGFSRSVDNMGGDVAAGLSLEGDSLSRASTGQGARPRPQELPPLPGGVPIEKSLETAKLRKLNAHRREERIRSAVGGGGPH